MTTTNEDLIAEARMHALAIGPNMGICAADGVFDSSLGRVLIDECQLVQRLAAALVAVPAPPEAAWRKAIADQVRRNCTLDWDTVRKGGDALIYAVCDWIESPPEWSTFIPPVPPQPCQECDGAGARIFDSGGTERERVTCATCGSHPPVSPEGGE